VALDRRMLCRNRSLSRRRKSRAEIAHAGQARTMAQHTYRHSTAEILGFVDSIGD
jgi:spore maturation protein CgeB